MLRNLTFAFLAALTCGLGQQSTGAEQNQLTRFVPESANAVAIIDVPAIHRSPVGLKEDWQGKHEELFLSGALYIPPDAQMVVAAAQIDPHSQRHVWESAVYQLQHEVALDQLALLERSEIETV